MNTNSPSVDLQKAKLPVIVLIACIILLLFSLLALFGVVTTFFNPSIKQMIGEKNYYLVTIGGLISIVMIVPIIGIFKMKKSSANFYVVLAVISMLLGFATDTMPTQRSLGLAALISPIISWSIIF